MSHQSDPIADLFTRVRNSARSGREQVKAPFSRIKGDIARVLKEEGYIKDYIVEAAGRSLQLCIINKYVGRVPVITGVRRISRPGLRRYVSATSIPRVLGGMGVAIVSTSGGVVSGRQASKMNAGGELVGVIW